jgi:cation:H+ antiporter
MVLWLGIVGLIVGMVILFFSSDLTVDKLISLASLFGASVFTVGFIFSSIGSDLPEIVSGMISAYIGHGGVSVGNSLGSVNTQISLILGLIPFFCTFCRLIPRSFAIVGFSEVVILLIAVLISIDGNVTRLDGLMLILLWGLSILILRRFGEKKIAVEESEELPREKKSYSRLILLTLLGFIGIAIGSYLVVESVIAISRAFGVSEYLVSFFFLSLGTSMPELIVAISAIRKRYFELALGDIIGSCIVDATLAIGIGSLLFPITVNGNEILLTGVYAVIVSTIVVSVLAYRGINDKRSGALFLLVYLGTWILPLYLQS